MLIRFSVENLFSFKERERLSLIPGLERLKKDHKGLAVNNVSALKTSVIYGANASGKSNLIKALSFGKKLILRKGMLPGQSIDQIPFKLDSFTQNKSSRLEYEIQSCGKNYAYGFVFNTTCIVEEWLYEISKGKETMIFSRDKKGFNLDYVLTRNSKEDEKQFLKFLSKSTLDNQLFLNKIFFSKTAGNVTDIKDLNNVLQWFITKLTIIFPDDKYKEGIKSELTSNEKIKEIYKDLLHYFDTGIDNVCLTDIDVKKLNLPPHIYEAIKEDLINSEQESIRSTLSTPTNTYFLSKGKKDLRVQKFMTMHKIANSKDTISFDTASESDGTNRLIDYIPVIIDLMTSDKVFIIDEMERSLHPNLIYDIFDLYLSHCAEKNSQLIIATHESSLLTQKLLRKDEIWFVVKDKEGASHLNSLNEYNVRFDKQIRKDYLLGRFRGVPKFGSRFDIAPLFYSPKK
jgi:Predicted ATPases